MATISSEQELHPVAYDTLDGEFGKDRFIGIEIETVRNESMLPKVDGVEWETADAWRGMTTKEKEALNKILDPSQRFIAMIGYDGGDIEVTTEPMSRAVTESHPQFNEFLHNINRYCVTSEASGTHVHVSQLPKDNKNLWRNLYWFSVVYDKQLYSIFRRRSTWALSPKEILKTSHQKISINDVAKMKYPCRGNKGTLIIKRANTYECRGGAASTETNEIKAWALMFWNIVELCNQSTIVGHRFEEVLPDGNLGEMLKVRLTGEQLRQICPIDLYL